MDKNNDFAKIRSILTASASLSGTIDIDNTAKAYQYLEINGVLYEIDPINDYYIRVLSTFVAEGSPTGKEWHPLKVHKTN